MMEKPQKEKDMVTFNELLLQCGGFGRWHYMLLCLCYYRWDCLVYPGVISIFLVLAVSWHLLTTSLLSTLPTPHLLIQSVEMLAMVHTALITLSSITQ